MDEKHDVIDGLFKERIERGRSLLEAAKNIQSPTEHDPRLVMGFFYAKALRDYRAAHILWMNGFGPECWAIGRSLIELALQAALLRQDPKSHALAYFRHGAVKRYSTAVKLRRLVETGETVPPPEITFSLTTPKMVELRKQYDAYKDSFYRDKKKKAIWDNWWKGNLSDLVNRVRGDQKYGQLLFDEYHVAYRFSSSFIHSAEMILHEVIVKSKDGFRLVEPKVGSEQSAPMHLTRRLMLLGIFLNEICKLGFDELLKGEWEALDETFRYGQEQLTKEALGKG